MATKEEIKQSPYYSYWLKQAVEDLDKRDPLDALRDVQILEKMLKEKLQTIQSSFT